MAMSTGGGRGALSEINVTPLVDVMLVLLVVFIVTAPLLAPQSLKVNLPKTDAVRGPLYRSKTRSERFTASLRLPPMAQPAKFKIERSASRTTAGGKFSHCESTTKCANAAVRRESLPWPSAPDESPIPNFARFNACTP